MKQYQTVSDFLADLDEEQRQQVETVREIILAAGPQLEEHIKWNSPSYVLNGEDRITFNLRNKDNLVKLILHMGATRKENKGAAPVIEDKYGLVEWNSDIRGAISFVNLEDVQGRRDQLAEIIKLWLSAS